MALLGKLELINKALCSLGEREIQSLDAATPAANALAQRYDDTVNALLSFYPWSFSCKTYPLQQIDEQIYTGYRYVYMLPVEAISHPHSVAILRQGVSTYITEYTLEGGRLYANDQDLVARVSVRSDPDTWPPDFLNGVVAALASAVALPITHDAELKAVLEQEAWGTPSQNKRGGWIGVAMSADARNKPSRVIPFGMNPITQARFGG